LNTIDFIEVEFDKYCCFKEPFKFNFINNSLTLIYGPNGNGKTSIFKALPLGLYGMTPEGERISDLANEEDPKDCYVFTTFKINDVFYRTERYYKHKKFKDECFLINLNDNKVIKKGFNEIKAEIERLIIPFKLFGNTVSFGQKVKDFFTGLKNSEQREIFRKVIQLDSYLFYYKESDSRLKKIEKEINDINIDLNESKKVLQYIEDNLKNSIQKKDEFEKNKKNNILEIKKKIKEFNFDRINTEKLFNSFNIEENDHLDLKLKIQEISSKFDNLKYEIENKKNEIRHKFNEKKSEFDNKYNQSINSIKMEKNDELNSLNKEENEKLLDLNNNFSTLKNKLSLINKSSDNLDKKIKDIKKEITELEESLNKEIIICFACKQIVGKENVENLKIILSDKKNIISESEKSKESLEEKSKVLIEELQKIKLESSKIKKDFDEKKKIVNDKKLLEEAQLSKSYTDAVSKLKNLLSNKISNIEIEDSQKINDLNNEKNKLEEKFIKLNLKIKERDEIKNKLESIIKWISQYEDRLLIQEESKFDESILNNSKKEIEEKKIYIEKLNKALLEKEKKLKINMFWKNGFSMTGKSIPSMLIDESIPFMNSSIKKYLNKLGGRYLVSFDTLSANKSGEFKDKITIHVLDTKTKNTNYKTLSGGQTRLIDIATIFTLSDLQSKIQDMGMNIIMLDEIFDSLDEKNIEYVSILLKELSKNKGINVISHNKDVGNILEFDFVYNLAI